MVPNDVDALVHDALEGRVDALHLGSERGDDGEQRGLVRLFRGVQRKLLRRVGGEVEQQRRVVPGGVAIVAAAVGGAACLVDGLNTRGERLLNIA